MPTLHNTHVVFDNTQACEEPDDEFFDRVTEELVAQRLKFHQSQEGEIFVLFEGYAIAVDSNEDGFLCLSCIGKWQDVPIH